MISRKMESTGLEFIFLIWDLRLINYCGLTLSQVLKTIYSIVDLLNENLFHSQKFVMHHEVYVILQPLFLQLK